MATKKRRGRRADPSSKSGRVRELLSSGMTTAEIAKRVGCTVALVYNIKSKVTGDGPSTGATSTGATSKPGRKPASMSAPSITGGGLGDLGAILTAVKNAERERVQLRAALEKIATIIQDAFA